MSTDQLQARLRAAFLAEMEEQVRVMNADLLALEREPTNAGRIKSLFRVAHTLKGAARAANVPLVEQACHAMESLLAKARDRTLTLDTHAVELLFAAADGLADACERLVAGADLAGSPLVEVARSFTAGRRAGAPRRLPRAAGESIVGATGAPQPAARPEGSPERGVQQLRVDAATLDDVLAASGELRLARGRISVAAADARNVDDLASDVLTRWRAAVRQLRVRLAQEGAERTAELRLLEEAEGRFQTLLGKTGSLSAQVARDARSLGQAVDEVTRGIVQLRMRPFADICEALPRMVRDVAAVESKEVRLVVEGGDVEADRGVLDSLREPIVHLVRNAISHGIETPDTRAAAGKNRGATVTVAATIRNDRFVVSVSDDGAGVNASEVRRLLQRSGRPVPADDAGLARALFESGLSTRAEATTISGRGVGLDVVRAALDRIGGVAQLTWQPGRGTQCTLDCPLTLVTIRVVLVGVGAYTIAIPTTAVERLLRLRPQDIARAEGRDVVTGVEGPVPVVSLARMLGSAYVERAVSDVAPAVALQAAGRRLVVVADALLDECEVTVRALESGQRLPLVNGAAILSTGDVAPVLNAAAAISEGLRLAGADAPSVRAQQAAAAPRRRVLVVDDSITTRTLEQTVLDAAGFDVRTAVDGADAWRVLQENPFDLVVSDVEMPRMDGIELCRAIRSSPRLTRLPVILVTAMETAEQRALGMEAGADAYLGKSSFDQQTLLDVVHQFLG